MAQLQYYLMGFIAASLQASCSSSSAESGLSLLDTVRFSQMSQNSVHYARCCIPEHGLPWLRLRQHLWTELKFAAPGDETGDALADIATAQRALRGDELLLPDVMEDVRLERLDVKCFLGRASLQLLQCASDSEAPGCAVANIAKIARLVLGLTTQALTLMDVLSSGWPVHALLKVVLYRQAGASGLKRRQDDLQRILMQAEQASHLQASARTAIAQALEPACLYREPFDRLLCDGQAHTDTAEGALSRVAVALGSVHQELQQAAAARQDEAHEDDVAEFERAHARAILNERAEVQILEAARILREASEAALVSDAIAFEALLHSWLSTTRWPILGLLASIAAILWGPGRRLPSEMRRTSTQGLCKCTLNARPVRDMASIAAALRVLRTLQDAEDNADLLMDVARSREAEIACPEMHISAESNDSEWVAPEEGNTSLPAASTLRETAFQVLRAWELRSPTDEDFDQRFVMGLAHELRYAGPENFDTQVCVPGAQALAMVCALAALAKNRLQHAVTFFTESSLFGMTLLPCVLGREGRAQFERDGWGDMAHWMYPSPQRFMEHAFEPLVSSDKWWRGEAAFDGLHDSAVALQSQSHNACAGIPGVDGLHACHAAPRGGGSNLVVHRGVARLPLTKILGVGLMKAGSTAVWQALGAAVQLPMGFDCMSITASTRWRVASKIEPISRVLEACSEELFKWELAKDPALTPLANRLSVAWPAVSAHGERLRMYFLVREPFSWLRSFVRHMGLAITGPDADTQRFSVDNLPEPAVFTREKQLFLDTQRAGLKYTGYLDAAIQGWALTVDEYLRCPQRFVLVRYEDFVHDPLAVIEHLVRELGFADLWSDTAALAVEEAVGFQYQRKHKHRQDSPDFQAVFGSRLHARVYEAVASRAALLGYGPSQLGPAPALEDFAKGSIEPIDVPPLPEIGTGLGCET